MSVKVEVLNQQFQKGAYRQKSALVFKRKKALQKDKCANGRLNNSYSAVGIKTRVKVSTFGLIESDIDFDFIFHQQFLARHYQKKAFSLMIRRYRLQCPSKFEVKNLVSSFLVSDFVLARSFLRLLCSDQVH